jgi:hypothetical protein
MDPERDQPALAPTGDPRVDAAIEPLATVGDLELVRRPMVLEDVHARLRSLLGELGAPGAPVPGGAGQPGEPGRHGEQAELG